MKITQSTCTNWWACVIKPFEGIHLTNWSSHLSNWDEIPIYFTPTTENKILYTFIYLLWIPPPVIMICRHSTQFSRFVYTILLLLLTFVIFDLYLYIFLSFPAMSSARYLFYNCWHREGNLSRGGWFMWRMSNVRCCYITYTPRLICTALCLPLIYEHLIAVNALFFG